MAGVGFELNKLFRNNDKGSKFSACLWSTFSCCGSMIFSFLMLFIIKMVVTKFSPYAINIDAFMSYVTNTVFFSMLMYSILSYPISRYISDLIYEKKFENIISSFWGSIFCLGLLSILLYLPILIFSKLNFLMIILMTIFLFVLISTWIVIGYVTILKYYKKICLSFFAGFVVSILSLIFGIMFECFSIEFLIGSLILGYGTIMTLLYKILNNNFKINESKSFEFLQIYTKYPKLFFTSVFLTLGTLIPFYIFWFSDYGTKVSGFFRSNPAYDIPSILAYLTTLFTVIYFVAALEPNFYGYYKKYFKLLNTKGSFESIEKARNEMIRVLKNHLKQMTYWQMIITFIAAIIGSQTLYVLNFGMTQTMLGTYRLLCAGYFFLSIGNSLLLIQLYFSDYKGAFNTSFIFLVVTAVVSLISTLFEQSLWGCGVIIGAFVMCIVAVIQLENMFNNIEYFVLSSNGIFKKQENHFIYNITERIVDFIKKINKGIWGIVGRVICYICIIILFFICIFNYESLNGGSTTSTIKVLSNNEIVFDFEATDKVLSNPGVGFAPWARNAKTLKMDTSLVYVDLSFAEFEPEKGVFDFDAFEKKNHLEDYRSDNRQVVFRFYLDYPSDEKHMDIPLWLYKEIDGDGTWYDNSYGKGFSPNYSNDKLIKYYTEAITELGKRYGNDDFFLYIELGGIGHWGEWHVNVVEGIPRLPDYSVRIKYIEPFISTFKNSIFLMRYPLLESLNYNTGLYNDMLGDDTDTKYWLDSMIGGNWSQTNKDDLTNRVDAWQQFPIGGEFASSYDSNYILNDNFENTIGMLKNSHQTFIGPKIIVDEDSQDYSEQVNEILKNLGHRLYVKTMKISNDDNIQVDLTIANVGVAPIYTDVKTVVYLYDETGNVVSSSDITDQIAINSIIDTQENNIQFELDKTNLNSDAVYTLCIALLDKDNNEPIIELAMEKEYSDKVYEIGKFKLKK